MAVFEWSFFFRRCCSGILCLILFLVPGISQVVQSVPGLIKGYVIDGSTYKYLFGVSIKKD
ncbi:MAG: hypothetical protein ACKVOW_04120, partial [Chitinophagaceae bacterium]